MTDRYEMRFGGTGGQGMMLMGDIMAEAMGIYGGKEVLLLKSYGPEARGSACRSELAVSQDAIRYPVVSRPDFFLAMSQTACEQYSGDLHDDSVVLLDSGLVKRPPELPGRVYQLPITQISIETVGTALNANVVALGAISVLAKGVETESVCQCVSGHFPERVRSINERAFEAGIRAAERVL